MVEDGYRSCLAFFSAFAKSLEITDEGPHPHEMLIRVTLIALC